MTGRDRVESQGLCPVQQCRELDVLVAPDTRVGSATASYSATKSAITVVRNSSARSRCRTAPRPRRRPGGRRGRRRWCSTHGPVAGQGRVGDSAMCTAVTSWPASTARAIATAESTHRRPRPGSSSHGPSSCGGRSAPAPRPQATPAAGQPHRRRWRCDRTTPAAPSARRRVAPHGDQHVTGSRDPDGARRTGRHGDPGGIEQQHGGIGLTAGNDTFTIPGAASAGLFTRAPSEPSAASPASSRSRSAARCRWCRSRSLTASSTATAVAAIPGTFTVPARRPPSWPPPRTRGRTVAPGATVSNPTPWASDLVGAEGGRGHAR